MKYSVATDVLTLYFEGEINSNNSEECEKEVLDIISRVSASILVLDFEKLVYISSAGLRIVLKLKQKYKNVEIRNVCEQVYDILSVTGFTNILTVKKMLKEVSVDGCDVIGNGFFSTVYRLDKDMIIKVFNRTSDEMQIERELALAKEAFILGVPTAISYDIVKVKDKLGVRFEMLDCMSLKDMFIRFPEKYDELVGKYAELLKTINTTHCDDKRVPEMRDFAFKKLEALKDHLDEKTYQAINLLLSNIPNDDTFIHGDCHFKNIMVQGDEFLLIDMDTLSKGNFLFELANLYDTYIGFEEDDPGNAERFLGVSGAFTSRLYYDILKLYFGEINDGLIAKIRILAYVHLAWWNRVNEPNNLVRLNGCINRLKGLVNHI